MTPAELRFGHASVMGRLVVVTATLSRETVQAAGPVRERYADWPSSKWPLHTWRVWGSYPIPCPRSGWIVGCRQLQEGRCRKACGDYDDYEEGFLDCRSTVPAYLVSYWPSRAHVRVAPSDLRAWVEGDPPPRASTEEHRATLRSWFADEACHFPRDERGRFCS